MRMSRIIAALLLSVTVTTNAEGQLGGLIKKTVKEATKPKDDKANAEKARNTPPDPKFPYELNAASMAAFKRGLELEIKTREDYKAAVAKLKTKEQFQQCTMETAMSLDAQKYAEEYSKRADAAKTPDESQKAINWLTENMGALQTKRCGDDPEILRREQYNTFKKAEELGALEFAKAFTRTPRHEEPSSSPRDLLADDCLEGEGDASMPLHVVAECPIAFTTGQQEQSTEEKLLEYRRLKELIEKYCSLSREMRDTAQKNGISVPGQGENIYWVFNRGFAIWVGDDCDHLLKLFSYVT